MFVGIEEIVIKQYFNLGVKKFPMTVSEEFVIGALFPSVFAGKVFELIGQLHHDNGFSFVVRPAEE